MQSGIQRAIDMINRCNYEYRDTLALNFDRALNFKNLNRNSINGEYKDAIA